MVIHLLNATWNWATRKFGLFAIVSIVILFFIIISTLEGLARVVSVLDTFNHGPTIFFALALGWYIGRKNINLVLVVITAITSGLLILIIKVGVLLGAIFSGGRIAIVLLWKWVWQQSDFGIYLNLFHLSTVEISLKIQALFSSLIEWVNTGEYDPTPVLFAWLLGLWLISFWASWVTRRYKNVIVAAIPAGVLLSGSLSFTGAGSVFIMVIFVSLVLMLSGISNYHQQEQKWDILTIAYSEELRLEIGAVLVALVLGIGLVATVFPRITIPRYFGRWFKSNQAQSREIGDSLGFSYETSLDRRIVRDILKDARLGGLPQRHLIGSGPELADDVVLIVEVQDPMGVQGGYYWRSLTYDTFNGQGWFTGLARTDEYKIGEPTITEGLPNHRIIRQHIQNLGSVQGLAFGNGMLLTMDHDYSVSWRFPPEVFPDIFGVIIDRADYFVDTLVPTFTIPDLLTASDVYPDKITERYLNVPPDLAPEVYNLAFDVSKGATTPFEKALAIESYLRTFPYTTDIPQPPEGKNLVEYFLFDLQKGYCDYYSTSMVILARILGLPARLAVGYASGKFDTTNNRFIVTADNAHSWVEIYFPDFGWIPFEPTGGLPQISRGSIGPDMDPDDSMTPFRGDSESIGQKVLILVFGVGYFIFIIIILASLYGYWSFVKSTPEAILVNIYKKFYKQGSNFGLFTPPGTTPYEYEEMLINWLQKLGLTISQKTISHIDQITNQYVYGVYSENGYDQADIKKLLSYWRRLRSQLWLLRWKFRWSRLKNRNRQLDD